MSVFVPGPLIENGGVEKTSPRYQCQVSPPLNISKKKGGGGVSEERERLDETVSTFFFKNKNSGGRREKDGLELSVNECAV